MDQKRANHGLHGLHAAGLSVCRRPCRRVSPRRLRGGPRQQPGGSPEDEQPAKPAIGQESYSQGGEDLAVRFFLHHRGIGQLAPQQGTVRLGTNLQVAYFDQLRGQLNDEATVQENVGDGYDTIQINGQSRHIIGYLQDFLFSPERSRTPVRFLSGGQPIITSYTTPRTTG